MLYFIYACKVSAYLAWTNVRTHVLDRKTHRTRFSFGVLW